MEQIFMVIDSYTSKSRYFSTLELCNKFIISSKAEPGRLMTYICEVDLEEDLE